MASGTARVIFQGGDTAKAMTSLKEKSLSLQKEREELLQKAGLHKDALFPRYRCEKCEDTGYIDGRMCNLFKAVAPSKPIAASIP